MIYIAGEVLRGSCFLLFPDGILHTEVERDNNEHAWKKKLKREKWNDIDTSKAVRSYIEAECGFYMLMVCWRALHLKEFFYFNIIILGQTIRERKMKESSRKKSRTKSGKKHCDWEMWAAQYSVWTWIWWPIWCVHKFLSLDDKCYAMFFSKWIMLRQNFA